MSEKIYISGRMFPVSEEQKAYLASCAAGGAREAELIWRDSTEITPQELSQADALINYPPAVTAQAGRVRWVQLTSAGADAYAAPGILPEDCTLTNSSGAYSLSVGEHMIAQTFALIRHLGEYRVNQTEHAWKQEGSILSVEGSVIAVLGLGDIGGFYARKMAALGAHVTGVRRHEAPKPDYLDRQVTMEHLHEILPEADVVAMVLPGGKQTEHLMSDAEFALMKEGSFLLNVGRGSAVDPAALCRALDSGRLRGAALDVTEPEPLAADDPLWDRRNVLITPHVAGSWYLQETLDRVVGIIADNLVRFVNGEPLLHVVNRKLGY